MESQGEWVWITLADGSRLFTNNPVFDTEADASAWMYDIMESDHEYCVDNYRFTFLDDDDSMNKYQETMENGCCGFFDRDIIVAGREATIGCNYGH